VKLAVAGAPDRDALPHGRLAGGRDAVLQPLLRSHCICRRLQLLLADAYTALPEHSEHTAAHALHISEHF
jgi:hypothetical protein